MKKIIPLLFLLWMISCESEQIIVEKIVYVTDTTVTRIVRAFSFDSVRTTNPRIEYRDSIVTEIVYLPGKDSIVYRDSIVHLPGRDSIIYVDSLIYLPGKDSIIEKIIEKEVIVYDTLIRIDTVERQAKLVYDPELENYVDSFFVFADQKIPVESRLAVDIVMEVADLGVYVSSTEIVEGDYLIKINTNNCYEAGIYRELLHTLYARPYAPYQFHPMIQNWEDCLEDHVNRSVLIDMMFIE